MNRRWLISISVWIAIIFVGSWLFGVVKNYFSSKDEINVSYTEALSLLRNEGLSEVEIRSYTNGHDLKFRLKGGKVFSCFTSDPNIHDRLLTNSNIRILETRGEESQSLTGLLISLLFLIGTVVAITYIVRDSFRRREEQSLRKF
jgi:hypothetical protein